MELSGRALSCSAYMLPWVRSPLHCQKKINRKALVLPHLPWSLQTDEANDGQAASQQWSTECRPRCWPWWSNSQQQLSCLCHKVRRVPQGPRAAHTLLPCSADAGLLAWKDLAACSPSFFPYLNPHRQGTEVSTSYPAHSPQLSRRDCYLFPLAYNSMAVQFLNQVQKFSLQ